MVNGLVHDDDIITGGNPVGREISRVHGKQYGAQTAKIRRAHHFPACKDEMFAQIRGRKRAPLGVVNQRFSMPVFKVKILGGLSGTNEIWGYHFLLKFQ